MVFEKSAYNFINMSTQLTLMVGSRLHNLFFIVCVSIIGFLMFFFIKVSFTGYGVYEENLKTWDFSQPSDYSFDALLINFSSGVRLQSVTIMTPATGVTTNRTSVTAAYKIDDDNESELVTGKVTALDDLYVNNGKDDLLNVSFGSLLNNGDNLSFYIDPSKAGKIRICLSGSCASPGYGEASFSKSTGWVSIRLSSLPSGSSSFLIDTDSSVKFDYIYSNYTDSYNYSVPGSSYTGSGEIETADFSPSGVSMWNVFNAYGTMNQQTLAYSYSTDSGVSWVSISNGSNMSLPASSGKIRLKAALSSDGTSTPVLSSMSISYSRLLCSEDWRAVYGTCLVNDSRLKTYSDANNCRTSDGLPSDNSTYVQCDYCTPSWAELNRSCLVNDTLFSYFSDTNSCFSFTGLASDNNPPANKSYACDYCTPHIAFFNTSCRADDTLVMYANDSNGCYSFTGIASDNVPGNVTLGCDYCTPSWACSSYSSCSIAGRRACTGAVDVKSCYQLTGLWSDSYQGNYSEFDSQCFNEAASFRVAGFDIAPRSAESGKNITVVVNISDMPKVSSAFLEAYGSGRMKALSVQGMAGNSTFRFIIPTSSLNKGIYTMRVNASDYYNNSALFDIDAFAVSGSLSSLMKSAVEGKNLISNDAERKVSTSINFSKSVNGTVFVATYNESTKNETPASKKQLHKYVEIIPDESIRPSILAVTIRINYSDDELSVWNIDASSLAIYYYNESSSVWERQESSVNLTGHYVEAVVAHASLFGVFGDPANAPIASAPNGDGSSGSDGGGADGCQSTQECPGSSGSGPVANETNQSIGSRQGETEKLIPDSQRILAISGNTTARANASGLAGKGAGCDYSMVIDLPSNISMVRENYFIGRFSSSGQCSIDEVEMVLKGPVTDIVSINYSTGSSGFLRLNSKQANANALRGLPVGLIVNSRDIPKRTYTGSLIVRGIVNRSVVSEESLPLSVEVGESRAGSSFEVPPAAWIVAAGCIVSIISLLLLRRIAKRKKKGR